MKTRPTPRRRPARRHRRARGPLPDRHLLYEEAVQDAGTELELLERVLRRAGRRPLRLREDFCGTALLASTWVARGPARTAVAVDLDPAVLAWARAHRLPLLGAMARRLSLVQADVRKAPRGPFDAILALNFSWQVFQRRADLEAYLAHALRSLAPGGVIVLDLFGGWLAQQALTERRRIRGGHTYVWEHVHYEPITSRLQCAIHFTLRDGRRMPRAFTYDWRLWTLREVTELLEEVGFEAEVLWDVEPVGADPRYVPRTTAENMAGWLAHVVGRRPRR